MTSRDFAYWLQGFFEIGGNIESLDKKQTEMVKKHLALVFFHEIDPSYTKDKKKQKEMNKIHDILSEVKPTKIVHEYKDLPKIRC